MSELPASLAVTCTFYKQGEGGKFYYGPDGGVELDTASYDINNQTLLGLAHFDYDVETNSYTLAPGTEGGPTQMEIFESDVEKLNPKRQQRERKDMASAARVAASYAEVAPRIVAPRTSRRRGESTQAGRVAGAAMKSWTNAFVTANKKLNKHDVEIDWEVYAEEHLPAGVYEELKVAGKPRKDFMLALHRAGAALPGACSCTWCDSERFSVLLVG